MSICCVFHSALETIFINSAFYLLFWLFAFLWFSAEKNIKGFAFFISQSFDFICIQIVIRWNVFWFSKFCLDFFKSFCDVSHWKLCLCYHFNDFSDCEFLRTQQCFNWYFKLFCLFFCLFFDCFVNNLHFSFLLFFRSSFRASCSICVIYDSFMIYKWFDFIDVRLKEFKLQFWIIVNLFHFVIRQQIKRSNQCFCLCIWFLYLVSNREIFWYTLHNTKDLFPLWMISFKAVLQQSLMFTFIKTNQARFLLQNFW